MKKKPEALLSNIHFLQQGIELLETITDDLYTKNNGKYNKSGIGRHFRHIIKHYVSLIDAKFEGIINYDDRARDLRLENDREFMIYTLKEVVDALKNLENTPVLVHNKVEIVCNSESDKEEDVASSSSVLRELQFLVSHTVHHYALIGLILKTMGFSPEEDFGVAPSTLKHEKLINTVEKAS